jgi:hypothetical protein
MLGEDVPRIQFIGNDIDVRDVLPAVVLQTSVVRTQQNVVVQGSPTGKALGPVPGPIIGTAGTLGPDIVVTGGVNKSGGVGASLGQTGVIFVPPAPDPITDGGDVVFANNAVVDNGPGDGKSPVIAIQAWTLALTGNRVRAIVAVPFGLTVGTWTATGNVTRGQPAPAPTPVPAPYQTYNVVT